MIEKLFNQRVFNILIIVALWWTNSTIKNKAEFLEKKVNYMQKKLFKIRRELGLKDLSDLDLTLEEELFILEKVSENKKVEAIKFLAERLDVPMMEASDYIFERF